MLRLLLLLPLAVVLLSSPVRAELLAEAAVRTTLSGGIFSPIMPACLVGGFGTTNADVSCSEAGNFGRGRAQAAYGSLKSYAELSSGLSVTDNKDYQAFGRSRFTDTLTLSSPMLTPGIPTFTDFYFDVTQGPGVKDGPPSALFTESSLIVKANGLTIEPGFGGVNVVFYSITMFPGSPTAISVELVADVKCFGCDVPYEGIVDSFGTATLLRVDVGILDPSEFTITGENENYANIVPEPSSEALNTVALLAIVLAGSARDRQSRKPAN